MVETFQNILQNVCLAVLAVVAVVLAGIALGDGISLVAEQALAFWRSLTGLGRVVFVLLAFGCVLYGSSKTNLPQRIIAPFRAIARQAVSAQAVGAEFFAANWNKRGAWRDSLKFDFAGDWVFPHGSNHLASVEVMSWGEVRTARNDTNAIASVGVPLAIVPGLTEFAYELTPSNSYRFAWTDAAANRDTNTLVTATIDLMRCGDVVVTTNGIASRTVRTLPFDHDGYGQDDEWVAANFTNATEIAAAGGYTNWVVETVGTTANGLYKFTVVLESDPVETVNLTVGEMSVAVDAAGEYSFVLEKGVRYGIAFSWLPDGVTYSYDDGVAEASSPLRAPVNSPDWIVRLTSTGDAGGVELVLPTRDRMGHITWIPSLSITPKTAYDPTFPAHLHAQVDDLPMDAIPSITWTANGAVIDTDENCIWSGDEDTDLIEVTATYRSVELHGTVEIERHVRNNSLELSGGGPLLVEDAYTNAPGEVVAASSTSANLELSWSLAEAGTLRLESDTDVSIVEEHGSPVPLPVFWHGERDEQGEWIVTYACPDAAQSGHVGDFTFTFTTDSGNEVLTRTTSIDVVKLRIEAEADWPSNKVRHVFGPMEKFTIASSPQVSLSVPDGSPVLLAGENLVIAPDYGRPFDVTASYGSASKTLQFVCIEPTDVKGDSPRPLTANEWDEENIVPLSPGEAGVAMMHRTWLEPLYVSFKNIRIFEGEAPPTNRQGWYSDSELFPDSILEHSFDAGASPDPAVYYSSIIDEGNWVAGTDFVASFMMTTNEYFNGYYQLNIPQKWYAVDGSTTNVMSICTQEMWIFTNGTMRISKHGVTWERRLDGEEYQVEECQ